MKILVLSDSHGAVAPMVRAVELTDPDQIFHLGDCWRDGERLHDRFPDIPMEQVWMFAYLCHTYGVKQSLTTAGFAAEEQQLDLFLFGHTHQPLVDRRGKTLFLNPGSIGSHLRPSYALVTIEDGRLDGGTAWLEP